jgi:hypothetical protein
MIKVVRMTKPEAARIPVIRELFMKALSEGALAPEVSYERVIFNVKNPNVCVLIGLQDGFPRALFVGSLPPDPRTDRPLIDLAANTGSPELGRQVMAVGLDFFRAAGYHEAWCFNHSGHSDEAYLRALKRWGKVKEAKKRSTLVQVDF